MDKITYHNVLKDYIEKYKLFYLYTNRVSDCYLIGRVNFKDLVIGLYKDVNDYKLWISLSYRWYNNFYLFAWTSSQNTFYSIVNSCGIDSGILVIHKLINEIVKDREISFSTRYSLK